MSDFPPEASLAPDLAARRGLDRCFVYRGPSMAPLFRPGDLLFLRPLPLAALRVGDVVVFAGEAHTAVAHRVVRWSAAGPITRGDANSQEDPTVLDAARYIGRVEALERAGRRRRVLNGRAGWWLSRALRAGGRVSRLLRLLFGFPYRRLRASATARRLLWRWVAPRFAVISLPSAQGRLVKYTHRGRVVARWWPETSRWECRKPYDLFLARPDAAPDDGSPAERSAFR